MKTNEFFDAMGKIDPALIERADRKVERKLSVIKLGAIAAVVALLAAGMLAVLPMLIGDGGEHTPGDAIVWENVFAFFDTGKGSGLKIYEVGALAASSFAEFTDGKYEKYELGNCFPKDKGGEYVSEKLDDTTVRTGWHIYIEEKDRDVQTVDAEVYEIKGVSPDAAIAIKYVEASASFGTEHYYVALNTEYKCETLAEFFDDFNAAVHIEIGKEALAREYAFNSRGDNVEKYRMNDGVPSDICKLLLGFDASAETVGALEGVDAKIHGCDNILRFTFAMNSAGRTINFLYVLDNGYIAVQGIGEGYTMFNVGRENTDTVFEILKEGGELVTLIPPSPDGDDLVEATTSAPVNEVVPE